MEGESIIKLTSAWYQAPLIAWFYHMLDPPRGYRNIYVSGLAFQTEGERRIHLPLLSRVKVLLNIIPLNFQVVHMCHWAGPMSSHASTSTGKTWSIRKREERSANLSDYSHMRLVRVYTDMVTSEDASMGITRKCPQFDKGHLQ